jgi:calcium-dependent protein kinase
MFVNSDGELTDHYKIGPVIGDGSFGEVRQCTHRVTKEKRAVKVLRKKNMDALDIKNLMNSVKMLRELDHPNILKVYEIYEDDKCFYLVCEQVQGG